MNAIVKDVMSTHVVAVRKGASFKETAARLREQWSARASSSVRACNRYASGELSLDVSDMRERLLQRGLRYVDTDDGPGDTDDH